MNFVKKLLTILIVLFTTISFAQSDDQIVYLDPDNIVSNTKAGKLIIDDKFRFTNDMNFVLENKQYISVRNNS